MSLLSCSFLNAQSKDTILAKVFWYRNLRSFTWAIIKVLKTPGSVEQHCWMWFSVSAFQFSTRKFIRWKMEQLFGFSGNMNHVNKCMDSTALSCSVLIRWLMSDHVCLLFPSATLVWSDSLAPPWSFRHHQNYQTLSLCSHLGLAHWHRQKNLSLEEIPTCKFTQTQTV